MVSTQMTVGECLKQRDLALPGSDNGRTYVFLLFSLLVLFLISDTCIMPIGVKELEKHRAISSLLLIVTLVVAVVSMYLAWHAQQLPVDKIRYPWKLFMAKVCINTSVLLFFVVICYWVLLLGGVTTSPFATLLAMSPIVLTLHLWRDWNKKYTEILDAISLAREQRIPTTSAHYMKRVIVWIGVIPFGLVLVTLVPGELAVRHYALHEELLRISLETVTRSEWYLNVYFWLYYTSACVALFGAMDDDMNRRVRDWLTA